MSEGESGLRFTAADSVDFDRLVTAFNAAYEGYLVPLHLTAEQVWRHFAQHSMNLMASRLAWQADEIAGVALLGIRGRRSWVGGFGVATAFRRMGIGQQMMTAMIDSARERNLDVIQLEVIDGNEAAQSLYRKAGYVDVQRLLILECPAPPALDSAVPIEAVNPAAALQHYDRLHALPNPWQRERATLKNIHNLSAWWVRHDDDVLAYVIGGVDKQSIRLLDVAGDPAALSSLVSQIHAQYPTGRLLNLGEEDPANAVLQTLGYQTTLTQIEMHLKL
jgi:RimJ/RimL family protein N-acetyltransferase